MNRDFLDRLARQLGIPPEEQAVLEAGDKHPRTCRCDLCREWWRLMGADPDNGRYGPFTREEIEGGTPEASRPGDARPTP